MHNPIATTLESLAQWRGELDKNAAGFARFLADHDLLDDGAQSLVSALRERLSADKLILAFVAEFSRGKSELINAIFFGDSGRRVLPATPGRTTMCPVELFYDAKQPPRLQLLPIRTRLEGQALAELRGRNDAWESMPLDAKNADALAGALSAVTCTTRVSRDEARALGFWNDDHPEDNPPIEADGTVEVPAWRHALINFPHPLLERGLVVLDTPGLNAIGAEPELTLSLLPSAHATVFVLAADTGVTKSDLTIWREHLGGSAVERFVVLNKIDALVDPLGTPAEVQAQIERQREQTAAILALPRSRVFPLSARNALAARVAGDAKALHASRLPELETALGAELLPRQQTLLVQSATATLQQLHQQALRRLADRRRQCAEQLLELRGLRGKSAAKVRMMVQRVDTEMADFDSSTARLAAVRSVQARMLHGVLARLSSDSLRSEVAAMQASIVGGPLAIGARQAFAMLFTRLHTKVGQAAAQADELRQMLDASFAQLNAEFGFAFALTPVPSLEPFRNDLAQLDHGYSRYLGLSQGWRMAVPGFAEQFRRMLLSKLRVIFETAASELELWSKQASGQVEHQLRERRRMFKRRREALEQLQGAAGGLEQSIAEVEAAERHLVELQAELERMLGRVMVVARGADAEATLTDAELRKAAA